ncbi:MAG TPA: DUF6049 family protein [Nocardioides sp.]|nr:DUF6049 family protein [Nocardioides sp.]
MTRSPLSTVLAAVVAVTMLPVLALAAPASAAPGDATADPLRVTIESMSPSVVPRRGRLTLSGVVTNESEDTWTDLQVYLLASTSPLTTREELAEAVTSDPATEVAPRLTTEGLFQEVGDLAPGESARYTVSVRRDDLGLSGEPGVYWTGVHVLGAVDGVREEGADGRARTFVPLLEPRARSVDVGIVVPFRDPVRRGPDGRLLGLRRWQRSLEDGRLRGLLDLVSASEAPLSWLLDPAVLDAAGSVARDNPPLATGDDGTGPAEEEPNEEASPEPSETTEAAPEDPGSVEDGTMVEATPEAEAAADWLEDLVAESASANVLSLPYGDVDVAAVTSSRLSGVLARAEELSAATTDEAGIVAAPVVAPPRGLLPAQALAAVDAKVPVVLAPRALPEASGSVLERPDGTRVLLLDGSVGTGGPGPDPRLAPVAFRQRVLAEAAVRSLAGARDPLLVQLPDDFDPGGPVGAAGFFDGLDVPWLRQVSLSQVLVGTPPTKDDGRPFYPPRERRRQVPFGNLLAGAELLQAGQVFADLLTRNDSVADELGRSAMLGSSYHARSRPGAARQRVRATTARVRRTMQLVDVDGPPFVMMSSETGPIAVTVVNNLEEPVTVRLEARTSREDLRITVPDPVTLEPGQRAPVRMRAEATAIGVHEVTLRATTADGDPLGSQVQFNVRTSNVGIVIWLVMGVGGGLLLAAIVWRIVRRVRDRRTAGAQA